MYSKEHINFLKKLKKEKIIVTLFQILILFIFIVIWQILANFNIINTFIFSSPKKVLDTIINLYNTKDLFSHIWVTIYETLIAFGIGLGISIIISIMLYSYPMHRHISNLLITVHTIHSYKQT